MLKVIFERLTIVVRIRTSIHWCESNSNKNSVESGKLFIEHVRLSDKK